MVNQQKSCRVRIEGRCLRAPRLSCRPTTSTGLAIQIVQNHDRGCELLHLKVKMTAGDDTQCNFFIWTFRTLEEILCCTSIQERKLMDTMCFTFVTGWDFSVSPACCIEYDLTFLFLTDHGHSDRCDEL